MLTIILSVLTFVSGSWFLQKNCFFIGHYVPSIENYMSSIVIGFLMGFFVGLRLSEYLYKYVSHKYPVTNKFPLFPFSGENEEIYVVKNDDGGIQYCRSKDKVETELSYNIASIQVDKDEHPYYAFCYPERASFWGLFATNIFPAGVIIGVPNESMIRKGRVDSTFTATHHLVLQ
ncbi:MAG: hypothetical protein AAB736_00300 [Patescibacteria group bacterium]